MLCDPPEGRRGVGHKTWGALEVQQKPGVSHGQLGEAGLGSHPYGPLARQGEAQIPQREAGLHRRRARG